MLDILCGAERCRSMSSSLSSSIDSIEDARADRSNVAACVVAPRRRRASREHMYVHPMAVRSDESNWYVTKKQLENTPSREAGIEKDKELSYRQQAANFIQDMGQRLRCNQLCINTAIVYMHRFYMHHSFTRFHRNKIALTAIYLAAKVEEQPRKLEHVIQVSYMCWNNDRGDAARIDPRSELYTEVTQELVLLENVMLQTLGFAVAIDHPHKFVVKGCQLIRASKSMARTSYFLATNSLHLSTFCLQYKPALVACMCIQLACKWDNWTIPYSQEGKPWYKYIEESVTEAEVEAMVKEFLDIMDKVPSKLKRKVMALMNHRSDSSDRSEKFSICGGSLGNAGGGDDSSDIPLSAMVASSTRHQSHVPSSSSSRSGSSGVSGTSRHSETRVKVEGSSQRERHMPPPESSLSKRALPPAPPFSSHPAKLHPPGDGVPPASGPRVSSKMPMLPPPSGMMLKPVQSSVTSVTVHPASCGSSSSTVSTATVSSGGSSGGNYTTQTTPQLLAPPSSVPSSGSSSVSSAVVTRVKSQHQAPHSMPHHGRASSSHHQPSVHGHPHPYHAQLPTTPQQLKPLPLPLPPPVTPPMMQTPPRPVMTTPTPLPAHLAMPLQQPQHLNVPQQQAPPPSVKADIPLASKNGPLVDLKRRRSPKEEALSATKRIKTEPLPLPPTVPTPTVQESPSILSPSPGTMTKSEPSPSPIFLSPIGFGFGSSSNREKDAEDEQTPIVPVPSSTEKIETSNGDGEDLPQGGVFPHRHHPKKPKKDKRKVKKEKKKHKHKDKDKKEDKKKKKKKDKDRDRSRERKGSKERKSVMNSRSSDSDENDDGSSSDDDGPGKVEEFPSTAPIKIKIPKGTLSSSSTPNDAQPPEKQHVVMKLSLKGHQPAK